MFVRAHMYACAYEPCIHSNACVCVAMAAPLFPFLGWLHRGHLLKERALSAYDLVLALHAATDLQDMGQGGQLSLLNFHRGPE